MDIVNLLGSQNVKPLKTRMKCLLLFTLVVLVGALPHPAHAAGAEPATPRCDITFNYEAAESLLAALQQTEIDDDQIERLIGLPGVRGMIDNTTKYIPESTLENFRVAVDEVVRTGQTKHAFALMYAKARKADAEIAINLLRRNEQRVIEDVQNAIAPYLSGDTHISATVYAVVGGVSDGFVLDGDTRQQCFIALDRAEADLAGITLNVLHELYHVVQNAERIAFASDWYDRAGHDDALVRLMMTVLDEGTANLVADPLRLRGLGTGSYFAMFEKRYKESLTPQRLNAAFALFDRLAKELHAGTMSWPEAYELGFEGEGPLYFVGYEMARTLEKSGGSGRLAAYFRQHPAQFFVDYTAAMGDSNLHRFTLPTLALIESSTQ